MSFEKTGSCFVASMRSQTVAVVLVDCTGFDFAAAFVDTDQHSVAVPVIFIKHSLKV